MEIYMRSFKIVSFVPWVNILILISLVGRVYFFDGHFPRYSIPDPKEMEVQYWLYSFTSIFVILSIFIWPLLFFIFFKQIKSKIFYLTVYLIGLLILWFLLSNNKLNLGEWILD